MNIKISSLLCLGIAFLLFLSPPYFAQNFPYYVLDGYGGVHSGGGTGVISPVTPYFGWDIAKAIQYVPVGYSSSYYGHGILVLDGFGGIHKGGELSFLSLSETPYFGWNIARDIALRTIPPKANYSTYVHDDNIEVTSTSYISIRSTYLYLPDDGYVLITASASFGNNDSNNDSNARVALGIDGTSPLDASISEECWVARFNWHNWRSLTKAQMTFVSAGYHTFHFLVKKVGTSGQVLYFYPNISAVYIDMSSSGYSEKPDVTTPGPGDKRLGLNIR